MSHLVTNWAWRQRVANPSAKLVLVKLADCADEDGICWPSLRTIARDTELSRDTVIRSIRLLKSLGLVTVTRRKNGCLYTSNKYVLHYKSKGAAAEVPHEGLLTPVAPSDHPADKKCEVVVEAYHPSSTVGPEVVAQSGTNHHIEPSIEPISLCNKDLEQEGLIHESEAKSLFGNLCNDVFGEQRKVTQWPEDELHWLQQALPMKRRDWENIDWFYRLPANHEVFTLTCLRQSMKALMKNLKSEMQKVRSVRKRLQLVPQEGDMSGGRPEQEGWTDKRLVAFEAMFPGAAPWPYYLLDPDLRREIDEKVKELGSEGPTS